MLRRVAEQGKAQRVDSTLCESAGVPTASALSRDGDHSTASAQIHRSRRRYRVEILDSYVFDSIEQAREITESWLPE